MRLVALLASLAATAGLTTWAVVPESERCRYTLSRIVIDGDSRSERIVGHVDIPCGLRGQMVNDYIEDHPEAVTEDEAPRP